MNPQIFQYKNQCVRDLAWVIASPPLITNTQHFEKPKYLDKQFFDTEYEKFIPLLNQLDDNPTQLLDHIESRNTRLLGKYFECLVEFWLMTSADKELLAANIQVEENKNTIGEIDFIYRNKTTDEIIHLEAAGKFYMSSKNKTDWNNFIGPNTNDNLGKKLNKLLSDQLTITENGAAKTLLKTLGISGKITPTVLLKGYLFYHADNVFNNNIKMPLHSEPEHRKGWWIRQNEKDKIFIGNKHWIILERSKWISPVYGNDYGEMSTSIQILEKVETYFTDNTYPLIVVELDITNNSPVEKTRGFVVSAKWPSL